MCKLSNVQWGNSHLTSFVVTKAVRRMCGRPPVVRDSQSLTAKRSANLSPSCQLFWWWKGNLRFVQLLKKYIQLLHLFNEYATVDFCNFFLHLIDKIMKTAKVPNIHFIFIYHFFSFFVDDDWNQIHVLFLELINYI